MRTHIKLLSSSELTEEKYLLLFSFSPAMITNTFWEMGRKGAVVEKSLLFTHIPTPGEA